MTEDYKIITKKYEIKPGADILLADLSGANLEGRIIDDGEGKLYKLL